MRTIEFKMERQGLVEIGQEVEITEHESDSGCCYIIEPVTAANLVPYFRTDASSCPSFAVSTQSPRPHSKAHSTHQLGTRCSFTS